jgi:hypothetical protein
MQKKKSGDAQALYEAPIRDLKAQLEVETRLRQGYLLAFLAPCFLPLIPEFVLQFLGYGLARALSLLCDF